MTNEDPINKNNTIMLITNNSVTPDRFFIFLVMMNSFLLEEKVANQNRMPHDV